MLPLARVDIVGRECGGCEACCHVLGVKGLKKDHERCPHQTGGGCAIYDDRPQGCRDFSCLWVLGQIDGDERRRPDKLGLIFFGVPTSIGTILGCWETWPGASQNDPGRYFLSKFTSKGPVLVCTEAGRFLVSPNGVEDWEMELNR